MRIVSTELRQVFRAYTKQLRGEYERAQSSVGRESVAKGFERVDISAEAQAALARSLSESPSPATEFEAKSASQDADETSEEENQEKSAENAKDQDPSSRNKELVR